MLNLKYELLLLAMSILIYLIIISMPITISSLLLNLHCVTRTCTSTCKPTRYLHENVLDADLTVVDENYKISINNIFMKISGRLSCGSAGPCDTKQG